MNYIRVCNWREYQHYKYRHPDWIKLHGEILGKPVWVMQSDATKLLAVTIMLLAARYDNRIPAEPEFVKRVAHLQQEPNFAPLVNLQFIEIIDDHDNVVQPASNLLAPASNLLAPASNLLAPASIPHQTASPERELELEKEKKELKPSREAKAPRGGNRKMADATGESRHKRIQGMIQMAYREHNGGLECPWDGGEASQLKSLLAACPGWVDSQIAQCLENMYRSEGFAKGTRPREFLSRLPRYLKPLNKFQQELSNGKSKADTEIANDFAAINRVAASMAIAADGGNTRSLPAGKIAGADDSSLPAGVGDDVT